MHWSFILYINPFFYPIPSTHPFVHPTRSCKVDVWACFKIQGPRKPGGRACKTSSSGSYSWVCMSTCVYVSRELCEVMFLFKYVSQRILMGLLLNDVMFPVKDVSERCRFSRVPLNVVSLLKDTPERSFISRFLTECHPQWRSISGERCSAKESD